MNREFSLFNHEQSEVEPQLDELMRIGYVQSPERFRQFSKDTPFQVPSLVRTWSETFKPTIEEFYQDFNQGEKGEGVFNEELIKGQNPQEAVSFWVKNALKPRPELEGSIWNEAKKKLISVSTKRAKEFNELEDKSEATDEQKMSALLVTLANIEAVKPIMTDVYPGLEWNAIGEAEEAMSLLLDEISKGKPVVLDKNTNVYIPRLRKTVTVSLLTTMLIFSIVNTACSVPPVNADGPGGHETLVVEATATSAKLTEDAPTRIVSRTPRPTIVTPPTPRPSKIPTEFVTPTEVGSKEIVWPAQGTETISQVEDLDLGMEFKNPEKAYLEMLGALIANKEYNGKFLQALLGTETPTVDQFLAYLRESKGPDGRPYYMPFTVSEIEYKWLTGGDSSAYGLRFAPQVSKLREGVYLEDFTTMMFTLDEYKQYKEAIDKIFEYNSKGGIKPNVRFEMFGLMITPDGRVVFIQGNLEEIHSDYELPAWAFEVPFGGADGVIDQTDIQKYTAGWMIYARAATNFTKDSHGQPWYCYVPTCEKSGGAVPYDEVTPEEEIVGLE